MTDQSPHESEPPTDDLQGYITSLEEIDTKIHELLEELSATDEIDTSCQTDILQQLYNARSEIDPVLLALRNQQTDSATGKSDTITLQWDPDGTPPRRLVFEPKSEEGQWSYRKLEWDGLGWRPCGRSTVEDVAIRTPTKSQYSTPTSPPTLDTLLEQLRGQWHRSDPPALVFDATATTEQGVLVAVDDELRYREQDGQDWHTVTKDDLYHHIQQQGQPTLTSLAETPLTREHFTTSPIASLESESESQSP
ncbi:hypothetical protein SAMN05444422_11460 [Halobiforma haloterrestris]|uniref:Uncharacterized protein n=1 Tax=Natronobacterium haloterrestre TaxID=148448 RepID=A0A1I1L4E3_NATHA|nr:hypothetical protein [Halobiforma haloterrestris]SFC67861.1 hypothetical protein SAMN05444422_11460 [Halobiforma haloterrestris]